MRPPHPLRSSLTRAAAGLAVCGAALAATWSAPGPAHAAGFPVGVSTHPVTAARADNFLGLALEYSTVPLWSSAPGSDGNPVLATLIRDLTPSGAPSLRIGGQSTDRSWWPVPGVTRPLGVTANLSPSWTASASELVKQTGAKLMLGIELEADSPTIARVEADELVRRIGSANIASLQIGNEPNLYRTTPWYRMLDGHAEPWYATTGSPVYNRPLGWDPNDFDEEFTQFSHVLPHLPLAGPETNVGPWAYSLGSQMTRHSQLRTLTVHAYGLNNCVKDPALPGYPTVAHLLTPFASREMYVGLAPSIAQAHRAGGTLRIDEMGSITCNGKPGVSNTFASALWAADALFEADRLGVDGVNLHSFPNSDNGLFDFTYSASAHRWRATIHPIFDGAYLFAQAAPAGSRILHITTPAQTTMRAWATLGADHMVRVLLINDGDAAQTVPVHAPDGYGSGAATVQRLTAPSPSATGGIELGGHPFSSTLTGIPRAPATTTLTPRDGTDTVGVPAGSAALVTIAPN